MPAIARPQSRITGQPYPAPDAATMAPAAMLTVGGGGEVPPIIEHLKDLFRAKFAGAPGTPSLVNSMSANPLIKSLLAQMHTDGPAGTLGHMAEYLQGAGQNDVLQNGATPAHHLIDQLFESIYGK